MHTNKKLMAIFSIYYMYVSFFHLTKKGLQFNIRKFKSREEILNIVSLVIHVYRAVMFRPFFCDLETFRKRILYFEKIPN